MATFSENLKLVFLAKLRETCNVTLASQAAGISSGTAYRHKAEDIIFQQRWDEALQEGIDLLEAEVSRRAFNGYDEPVYYQGMECGTIRKYSDGLAQFMLKSHRPEKYRERSQVDQNVSGGMQLIIETGVPRKTAPVDDLL